MDRLYSILSIANWLLKHGITMVGTMMLNRVGIPTKIKDATNREVFSTEIQWEEKGKRNLTFYVAVARRKRQSLHWPLLSLLRETIDDGKQNLVITKFYDFTRDRVDIINQKMGFSSAKATSHEWTSVLLAYLLDTICVNACCFYAINKDLDPKKQNSFDFGFQLAKSVVTPQIIRIMLECLMNIQGEHQKQINDNVKLLHSVKGVAKLFVMSTQYRHTYIQERSDSLKDPWNLFCYIAVRIFIIIIMI